MKTDQKPYGFIGRCVPGQTLFNLVTLAVCCIYVPGLAAEDKLGRLFTTPEQRYAMEVQRHKEPETVVQQSPVFIEETPVAEEQKPDIGSVTLHGYVYREGGKNTAWINNANTYEGNLGNQYIQIDASNIDPDKVVIQIPIADKTVKLKAGETYIPEDSEQDGAMLLQTGADQAGQ